MHQCINCQSSLSVATVHCDTCAISFTGSFELPRLARLSPAQQHLAEQLVLAAGNLKQMAAALEVSYPTLRKRLDDLVEAIHQLRLNDEARAATLLESVAHGDSTPETAARLIKEMSGAI